VVRLVVVVAALFCAFLTGNHLQHVFMDGDLFWQRRLGEYVLAHHAIPTALGNDVFSAPGAPWVPQEWLFSIIVAVAWAHGALWTIALLSGLAVFAALMLMAVRCKAAGAPLFPTLAILLFAGICMEASFSLRAQVWAWAFFAAMLLVLDEDGPRVWWAVPLAILWANVHASVMLVIPLVWLEAAAYIVGRYARLQAQRAELRQTTRRKKRDAAAEPETTSLLALPGVRNRLLLCAVIPFTVLCTPLGLRLPSYAIDLLNSPLRAYVSEWQPMRNLDLHRAAGMLPLFALYLYGIRKVWPLRVRDAVLPLLMAVWTVLAVRNLALFGISAAVPAALALDAEPGWENLLDRPATGIAATIAALLLAVPLIGWIGFRSPAIFAMWPPPEGSVAALRALPGDHRLFCEEYSWCSVPLGEPNIAIFIDGRTDPYPPAVWQDFATIASLQPGWEQRIQDDRINAILAWRGGPLEPQLRNLPGWREIGDTHDKCCVLFVQTKNVAKH